MNSWSSLGQRPRVGALLEVRPVAPVLRGDLVAALRVRAHHPRQRQQLDGLLQRDGLHRHVLEQRPGARLGLRRGLLLRRALGRRLGLGEDLGHVGPVPALLRDDLVPGQRVDPERATLLRHGEQLLGDLAGQLVRRQVVGQVRALGHPVADPLQVRPVAPDPHHDVVEHRDRVDLAGVDLLEVQPDQLLQPAGPRDRALAALRPAEVEAVEPGRARVRARRDRVELVLHRGGEVVVDEPPEVVLEQPDHRERDPGRHQRAALLPDVAAVLDRLDDRRVGRRAADAELLQRLDQARLGVAGGRVGGVAVRRAARRR